MKMWRSPKFTMDAAPKGSKVYALTNGQREYVTSVVPGATPLLVKSLMVGNFDLHPDEIKSVKPEGENWVVEIQLKKR